MPCPQIADNSILHVYGDAAMLYEKRMENDGDNNPIYVGYNRTPNAAVNANSWLIVKLIYSSGAIVRYQLPDDGVAFKYSWTDRATYFS